MKQEINHKNVHRATTMLIRIHLTILATCFAFCNLVHGDIIVYDDLESPGMFFTNVTESAVGETLPLFGMPTISGNSLLFDNPGFDISVNDGGLDFIDGRMTVTVTAKNELTISSVTIAEFGGYEIFGPESIVSANGVGFVSSGADIYQTGFQFTTSNIGVGSWSDSMVVNFAEPVDSFSMVLDNQLFATAGIGSSASIYKDRIEIFVDIVPEPSGTAAGIVALLAGCLIRRKR